MKTPRVLPIFCCCVALALMADSTVLSAAPTRKKSTHQSQDEDDSDANSSPSPSPAAKRSSRNKSQPDAAYRDEKSKAKAADDPTPSVSPKASADKEDSSAKRSRKESNADGVAPAESAAPVSTGKTSGAAATSSIESREIQDFDSQPEPIRKLLTAALDLTKRNLTYSYGSADPSTGGLDCSGAIHYLLKSQGFDETPRQANEQYEWVRKQARFYAVLSKKQDNPELNEMRPGDLLFWTGTYNIDRDPPVTHAMIYLGKRKKDGKRLMMGASDGRPYDGQRRNGVSVFDFKMPVTRSGDHINAATAAAPDHAPDFAGYGPVPGMAERIDAANRQASAAGSNPKRSDR